MTDTIEWGPEIPVNGKRPVWLKDCDFCRPCWGKDTWHIASGAEARHVANWPLVTAIRLPADHWAYEPISKGFEPWAGGDGPPEDWDGEVVLTANGGLNSQGNQFTSGDWQWLDPESRWRIIGYRKLTEPAEQNLETSADNTDYVRVKRMTEREWLLINHKLIWAETVGIIREETPLDKFTADHSGWRDLPVEDAVKLALEWRER